MNQVARVDKDVVRRVVPKSVYKGHTLDLWKQQIEDFRKQLASDLLQFLDYELNLQGVNLRGVAPRVAGDLASREQRVHRIQQIPNHSVKCAKLLSELMKQHPFFGLTFFPVSVLRSNQLAFRKYLLNDTKLLAGPLWLGVSSNGLHFIDEKQTT